MTTLSLQPCGLTLDEFARIMGISPCGLYGIDMGEAYPCKVWECRERTTIVTAIQRAQGLIENKISAKLCAYGKTLKATAPYFAVPSHWLLQTRRDLTVTMTVTPPEEPATLACETQITLTGTFDIAECEEIVAVDIAQAACACPRLPAEFCSAEFEVTDVDPDTGAQTIELTLVTRAYNLNDSDVIVDGSTLDWLPETIDIVVTLSLPTREAGVFWSPVCCPATGEDTCTTKWCCHFEETCGCIQRSAVDNVDVKDWREGACRPGCCPFPHHFELDVVVPGAWQAFYGEAVVSLANNFLPQDYCNCNPLASLRYATDTGTTEYAREKPNWLWNNPFGIYTPGAKSAWAIVANEVEKTKVFAL